MKNASRAFLATMCMILVLGFAVQASAQDKKIAQKDVPATVLSAFQKAYPNPKIKGYLTETEGGKTYYEIESVQGKTTIDALLLPDGTIYEVEEGLPAADLPAPVKAAVSGKYPKGKIIKSERTTRGSEMTYEMKVTSGKASVGLVVDPAGKIVKEQKAGTKKEKREEKH